MLCGLAYNGGMEGYMTVREAAAAIGVDGATVRRRLERGELRGERINPRLWLIPVAEVEHARQVGRHKPGPKLKKVQTPGDEDGEAKGTTP